MVTIADLYTFEIPIEALIFECKPLKFTFEESLINVLYKIGSGPHNVSLPAVNQIPACDQAVDISMFIKMMVYDEESDLKVKLHDSTIEIQSDDTNFEGQTVTIIVGVEHSLGKVFKVDDLRIDI